MTEQTETLHCLTCGATNKARPGPTMCGACGALELKWVSWRDWTMDERTGRWVKST